MSNLSTCEICMPSNYRQAIEANGTQSFERSVSISFYNSDDPISEFVEWLLLAFDNKYDTVIYSHNGGMSY